MADPTINEEPTEIAQFATQATEFVRRAVGVELEYDSETLPLLDHVLRETPADQTETAELMAAAAGAYFGEVVRRTIGGSWKVDTADPADWRIVLAGGISFSPVAMALAAIRGDDKGGLNASLQIPKAMQHQVEKILEVSAPVSPAAFYSLCGRLDTLEHIQTSLLALAADRAN